MRPRTALGLLIAAYLVLCAVYIAKTPYRQGGVLVYQGGQYVQDIGAPDERQHANYVASLLQGNGFPVLRPGSADLYETYQAHQPPLWYVMAAGFCKLVGADPTDPATGGRLRYLNALLGVVTLLGLFYAARWGLGDDGVGLAAVALAGLMPMFVALSSAVSDDPLQYLEFVWAVALCARGSRHGWDWRLGLALGLVLGAGLLTKTIALALFPTVVVALWLSGRWAGHRAPVRVWALVLVLPLLVASPWMARNQRLYGDPFAIKAFTEAFVGSPRPQDVAVPNRIQNGDEAYIAAAQRALDKDPGLKGRELIDRITDDAGFTAGARLDYWTNWVGWWAARSYIGVLGYMDIFLFEHLDSGRLSEQSRSPAVYRLLLALLAFLAVGGFLAVRQAPDGPSKVLHATNAVLLAVVLVFFVRFNIEYFQGQARYLYPAVAPISLGLALGLRRWLGRRKEWAWAVAGLFLVVLQIEAVYSLTTGFALRAR